MTTQIGACVFADPTEIRHDIINGNPTLTLGQYPTVRRVDLHLGNVACIDKMIAELVALKQEMDPPVLTGCAEVDDGYICNGHDDREHHVAYGSDGEVCHRWPVAAATLANPPHPAAPGEGECTGEDKAGGWMCTAQNGHDGPDHVAYRPGGGEYARWPVAAPAAGLVGRIVADAHDDSPVPVTGTIVGQVDEETVEVQWDGTSSRMREPIDALRPVTA